MRLWSLLNFNNLPETHHVTFLTCHPTYCRRESLIIMVKYLFYFAIVPNLINVCISFPHKHLYISHVYTTVLQTIKYLIANLKCLTPCIMG